MLGKMLNSTKG